MSSKKVFWTPSPFQGYFPDLRKRGHPREGRWQISFLKHVCKVKLMEDGGDREMEAQQDEEQQNRLVSVQHGLCVPTETQKRWGERGSPPGQRRRMCSVGTTGCPRYRAGPARRGCWCPTDTWSTALLGKACWLLLDFSDTLLKGQTFFLSEPFRKEGLAAPQQSPSSLPATSRAGC